MKFNLLLILIAFPILVSCNQCPEFQAVIPLRPTTNQSYSLAVVADGHYYLMTAESNASNWSQQKISHTGSMPYGFNQTRVITVIDRFDCNESQYDLIAIQSFSTNGNKFNTLFTKYDLLNESKGWSEPEPIETLPLLSKDTKVMSILSNFQVPISELIRTLIYWDKTKTLFVVTRRLFSKDQTFQYYSVNLIESCRHNYRYTEFEDLELAIPSSRPIDLCLFSELDINSVLYCLSENNVQINIIDEEFQNGTLRSHKSTNDSLLTVDQFQPIRLLCNITEQSMQMNRNNSEVESVGNRTDVKIIRMGERADIQYFFQNILFTYEPLITESDVLRTGNSTDIEITEEKNRVHPIWIVLFVVLVFSVVLSLIVFACIAVTDRSRQQLAQF